MTEKEFVQWLLGYFENISVRVMRNKPLKKIKEQLEKINRGSE